MRRYGGDILVLGVAGKMGPTLARMARRALDAAGVSRRVIGVSRFSSPDRSRRSSAHGVETIRCDLLDEDALAAAARRAERDLHGRPEVRLDRRRVATWAMNALSARAGVPAVPDESNRRLLHGQRVRPHAGGRGGSREDDPPAPVGEYAMSCLGRERMFEYFSRTLRHAGRDPPAQLRLRAAVRRARRSRAAVCSRREPIDLTMGHFNVIWQGDANAMALAALAHTVVAAVVVNLAGPEELSVRATCDASWRGC